MGWDMTCNITLRGGEGALGFLVFQFLPVGPA